MGDSDSGSSDVQRELPDGQIRRGSKPFIPLTTNVDPADPTIHSSVRTYLLFVVEPCADGLVYDGLDSRAAPIYPRR